MIIDQAIESINDTIDQIIEVAQSLSDEMIRWKPAEDKWSVLEILSHVEEATPYWLGELEQVIQSPGIEWGRGLQDEKRLAAVAQAGQRSVSEVLQGIEASKQKVQAVLGSLHEEELKIESPSRNPRFGTKPMSFIVEHLLIEHLAKHINQMKRNIQEFADAAKN